MERERSPNPVALRESDVGPKRDSAEKRQASARVISVKVEVRTINENTPNFGPFRSTFFRSRQSFANDRSGFREVDAKDLAPDEMRGGARRSGGSLRSLDGVGSHFRCFRSRSCGRFDLDGALSCAASVSAMRAENESAHLESLRERNERSSSERVSGRECRRQDGDVVCLLQTVTPSAVCTAQNVRENVQLRSSAKAAQERPSPARSL